VRRRERRKLAHVTVSEAALLGGRIKFVKKGSRELFVCLTCFAHWPISTREPECKECKDHASRRRGPLHGIKLMSDIRYSNRKRLGFLGFEVEGL
jgi:predicted metal-binding protein